MRRRQYSNPILLRARRAAWFSHIVKRCDLVAFSALADWLAQEPGKVERNERRRAQVLNDLRNAIAGGKFGAARKPKLFYMPDTIPPYAPGCYPLRPTAGQLGLMAAWDSDMTASLWAPRKLCNSWLKERGFAPLPGVAAVNTQKRIRSGRKPAPIWVKGDEFIDKWLDENGIPVRGDGEQARLETAVRELLTTLVVDEEKVPVEATVRAHVTDGIARMKSKRGVT
jgi:hypothetical protein